jgi:hypothetical protein
MPPSINPNTEVDLFQRITNLEANQAILSGIVAGGLGITTGTTFYLDPVNGLDGNNGLSPAAAVKTLAAGYALLTDGHNDVLVLIGNGVIGGSVLISSGFTWAKNAAHLIGACAPGLISQRARIAPVATPPFANFFTVSGNGCLMSNVEFVTDFTVGMAAEICMTVTGGRNVFDRCHIAGMLGATAAGDTSSRNLLVSGSTGENLFRKCTIGVDTTARTALNASLQFAGQSNRNIFEECIFPIYVSGGGTAALVILATGSSPLDRWNLFTRCKFLNAAARAGGSDLAALATIVVASGGEILLDNCQATGITAIYSDSATQAQIRLAGPVQSQVLAMSTPS